MSSFLIFGLVWVVGGNLLIHLAMKRVHARVRADLASSPIRFEEARVRARYSGGLSIRWTWGDLAVHERCAVLYQGNFIAQPPILLFRSKPDAATIKRWSLAKIVLTAEPRVDGDAVVLVGESDLFTWTLRVTTKDPAKLAAAVRAMMQAPPEPYR